MKYGLMCPKCKSINGFRDPGDIGAHKVPGKFFYLQAFLCAGCGFAVDLPPFLVVHDETGAMDAKSRPFIPPNCMTRADLNHIITNWPPSKKHIPKLKEGTLILKKIGDKETGSFISGLISGDIFSYDYCTGDDKCACPNCYEKNGYGD